MNTTTLQDIITSVQGLLQDDQFPEVQIIEAANWVQDELLNNNNFRFMEKSGVLSPLANAVTIAYPTDMRTVNTMYVVSPFQRDMDEMFISYKDFIGRFPAYNIAPAATLLFYTNFGTGIRFSAPLLTNTTINIDYFRNPVPMVNLSDICEIPDNYKEITSRATLARCMEQNEDYDLAANERNIIAPLITTFIRRESVGMEKTGAGKIRMMRRTTGWRK